MKASFFRTHQRRLHGFMRPPAKQGSKISDMQQHPFLHWVPASQAFRCLYSSACNKGAEGENEEYAEIWTEGIQNLWNTHEICTTQIFLYGLQSCSSEWVTPSGHTSEPKIFSLILDTHLLALCIICKGREWLWIRNKKESRFPNPVLYGIGWSCLPFM